MRYWLMQRAKGVGAADSTAGSVTQLLNRWLAHQSKAVGSSTCSSVKPFAQLTSCQEGTFTGSSDSRPRPTETCHISWCDGQFYAATISITDSGEIHVHYPGWSSSFDETITPAELQRRKQKRSSSRSPSQCAACGDTEGEDTMVLCDGCDQGYHMSCLTPPLQAVPPGAWHCPQCHSGEMNSYSEHQGDKTQSTDLFLPSPVHTSPVYPSQTRKKANTSQRKSRQCEVSKLSKGRKDSGHKTAITTKSRVGRAEVAACSHINQHNGGAAVNRSLYSALVTQRPFGIMYKVTPCRACIQIAQRMV